MKSYLQLLLFLIYCSTLTTCQFDKCADNYTLDMKSDGYQYIQSEYPSKSIFYREWWFFALYDPNIDLGFCIGYSVSDPGKRFGLDMSGIAGMLWTTVTNNSGTNPTNILDSYGYEEFSAYADNATVSIGQDNSIVVINPKQYQIIGTSKDGQLNWNLTFHQASYACRQKVDIPNLMTLDWISYMPSAYVSGVIEYKKTMYTINTTAYHDHNYGAWPTNLFNWVWAQFHRVENDFSLVLGSYHIPETKDTYIGYVFLRWRGERIEIGTLCGHHFTLEPLEWQVVDGKKYSIHNKVSAANETFKIDIEYKARVSNDNPGGRGLGLKVFEQISFYQVVLYQKQNEEWVIAENNLSGYGFSEWSHAEL